MTARGAHPAAVVLGLAVFVPSVAGALDPPPAQEAVRPFDAPESPISMDRFRGTVKIMAKDGTTRSLEVRIRAWIVKNRQQVEIPSEGFTVVQLRAGSVHTVVKGDRVERQADDIWTLPEGATMLMETGNDSVTFETIETRDAPN